ncbi:MAG: 2-C-methyl-D-erythritol 2,4-cyclodiphosphate synthase [Armatimonadetes bacterium]|nr:2-C-methyl-D-erythritol 2,4-cyclodiphosphate synthase [Armatimonadota bacterium]
MKTASALIPAAGRGERFSREGNKVFAELAGKPILAHTLSVFESSRAVGEIILVVGEHELEAAGDLVGRFGFAKVRAIVPGGAHRQDSVYNGLRKVTHDIVAIHDAARPMVTREIIERSIEEADRIGACIAAVPVIDTIKQGTGNRPFDRTQDREQGTGNRREGEAPAEPVIVTGTIDRWNLYSVQTPQTFRTELIRSAFERALAEGFYATDDAALVEHNGGKVTIVPGSYDNIKITTPSDAEFASRKLGGGETRTGMGFDVHRLVEGRKLILGGVEIPHEKGLLGHSDADVILHAIADACLGAVAMGDIGRHFPDTDPQYKGISSVKLLKHVGDMLASEGRRVINVDATVVCERPKIAPYVFQMTSNIAGALNIEPTRISVKATTTEGLGCTGRGEGIACYAVANVSRR